MREWKELLFNGLHLYEPAGADGQRPPAQDPAELKKQEILNQQDYDEYTVSVEPGHVRCVSSCAARGFFQTMTGEWVWPEDAGETSAPPTNNDVLGHVVLRLRNMVHPSLTELPAPALPDFTLKACLLGKVCSGKTTCLTRVAEGTYMWEWFSSQEGNMRPRIRPREDGHQR